MSKKAALAVAGPLLIAVSVLVVLHDYTFLGQGSLQTGDFLRFFSPRYCFLGTQLGDGALPVWNPYSMSGTPFIGDPLSGWAYLTPMVLGATLPCEAAMRTIVVLNPILAGLGIYWFARSEGFSRTAGTVGGLSLALAIAGSATVQKLHFSGSIAWTVLALAAISRMIHSERQSARVLWATGAAVALSQVAAAFLTYGLLLAGGVLFTYVLSALLSAPDSARRKRIVAGSALIVLAFPLVTMALILPASSFIEDTILADGYAGLQERSEELGREVRVLENNNPLPPAWPLRLALSPGTYVGAASVLLAGAGLFSSRRRGLAVAFMASGTAYALLSSDLVARNLSPIVESLPLGDVYAHSAHRLFQGVLIAIAILAVIGVETFIREQSATRKLTMVLPGLAICFVLIPLLGAPLASMRLLIVGTVATAAVVLITLRNARLIPLLAVVLACELVANGFMGQAGDPPSLSPPFVPESGVARIDALLPLSDPDVDIGAYMKGSPLMQRVAEEGGGRLLNMDVDESPRALFLNIETVEGYSSTQLQRYWDLVRALGQGALHYNISNFDTLVPAVLDLMQVRWVISETPLSNERLAQIASSPGSGEALYEVVDPPPRAEVSTSWTVAGPDEALSKVSNPLWSPAVPLLLESDPGIAPAEGVSGTAHYEVVGAHAAKVTVSATDPVVVLVRNAWHDGWKATVDGRPTDVIPADYLNQAVAVPAGDHVIELTYEDPAIGPGLMISLGTIVLLLVGAAILRRREANTATDVAPD